MAILITGGTGFIGSHTAISLIQSGYDIVIIDNLSNSSLNVLSRLERITGKVIPFYKADISDREILRTIFSQHNIISIMHFAGFKSVGESILNPIKYYENNVIGTLILAEEMAAAGIFSIVFSSSATVYGNPSQTPITEDMPVGCTSNPYGTSKYIAERVLQDIQASDSRWSVILLRYFNPIGAHESGLIGEQPNGIPNNLLPYICQVAAGKLPYLSIFGNDYDTEDGTGIRDYIHVVDLAEGHVRAMEANGNQSGVFIYNLGTGKGHSVLEVVRAFERVSGLHIPYQIKPRRLGDIPICFADVTYTSNQIRWQAQRDLNQMMIDAWRWQSRNPNGFE